MYYIIGIAIQYYNIYSVYGNKFNSLYIRHYIINQLTYL